jgi:aquaporin related protein
MYIGNIGNIGIFGLCLCGKLPWTRTAAYIPAQLLGCVCAGAVVNVLFPGPISGLNTTLAQGVFAEMFFTSYLVFVVLILAVEKSRDTFTAPIGIGLALFVAEIPGSFYPHPIQPPPFTNHQFISPRSAISNQSLSSGL